MTTMIGYPAPADEHAIRQLSSVLQHNRDDIEMQLQTAMRRQFRDPSSTYARGCFSTALANFLARVTLIHNTAQETILSADRINEQFEDFLFFPIDAVKGEVDLLERQVCTALIDHPVAALAARQALQRSPLALDNVVRSFMGYRDALKGFQGDIEGIDVKIRNIDHAFAEPPQYLATVESRLRMIDDFLAQAHDRAHAVTLLGSDGERSEHLTALHNLLVENVDPLHNIATEFPRVRADKTTHFWKIARPFQTRAMLREIMGRTFRPDRSESRRMSISRLSATSSGSIIAILIEAPDEGSHELTEALVHCVNGTRLADDIWPVLNGANEGIDIDFETLDETRALLRMKVYADTLTDVLHDLSAYEAPKRAPAVENQPEAGPPAGGQVAMTDSPLVASVLAYAGSSPMLSWTIIPSSLNPLKK